ncbi:RNA polymerase sigma factor [Planctomycetes bacterium Poly30]|uniref:RNA polymerase sigma factor n=1 Tax=Saltatorellus ferox TaxID=2528018 RepID=A0A518EV67_9BACT|nr:RNA polymerase sigma factor [Planctomycetes bacterium Poly30]
MSDALPHPGEPPDELMELVYGELRQLASMYLARERSDHTLQPTALVHEAFVKLSPQTKRWENRAQFVGVAAVAMRRTLVDHARQHRSLKRGGSARRVELDLASMETTEGAIDLVRMDDALTGLAQLSGRQAQVVELRFFGGLTHDEIAEVLGISYRTVENDWRFARAWLKERLGEETGQRDG